MSPDLVTVNEGKQVGQQFWALRPHGREDSTASVQGDSSVSFLLLLLLFNPWVPLASSLGLRLLLKSL